MEEYKKFDYERRKICKKCTEAAVSECVRYLTDLKRQNKKNTEDFIVINSSAVNYFNNLETNPSDMSIFREFLFKPVAELLNRNNRMQLVEYDVLRDLFQKANKSFTQITLSNKHLGEDSISYVGPINKAIEVVKEVLPELAEYVKK